MKKLISLLSICALCTGSLFAQNHTPPQVRQVKRAITTENVFAPQHYKLQPTASTRMLADVPENAIIWEDFSKFTEGSETTPGTVEVGDSEGNIPSEMTQMPGWVGVSVFQAGGAAYIGFFEGVYGKETGLITTPTVDFSANNGAVTLKFRAKSNATKDKLLVLLMESGMQYASSSARIDLTNEWTDYTILLDKGTEASFIQMYTQTEGWFIDDFQVIPEGTSSPDNIRVTSYKGTEATVAWDAIDGATYEYSLLHPDPNTGETIVDQGNVPTSNTSVTLTGLDPNLTYGIQVASVFNGAKSPLSALTIISPVLDGPTPTSPTDYDGTSFVAHWEAMENATTYTVYVSHSESNGMFETTVVDQKQTTSENSYKVTGLDPQIIYSYSVQAKLEDGEITMISEMVKVAPTIAAPVAMEATEVTDNSFVANWNASKRATHYQVTAYKEHTALTAGEYAVANADFSYIESTGTLETPEGIAQEYITPTESGAFNWNINLTAMMEGAIGLNNSYVGFLGRAFMHSPLYDLTPFGNKATFDITLASTDVTTAVIALAYVDEDSYLQEIESFEVPVSAEWTKQQVKFTKGGEAVCVLVYPKDGTYLMLQNFKLTIDMPQDSKIEVPYNRATKEGELSHKFENIVLEAGDRIGYDVIAAEIAGRDKFTSETSNRVWVELESSSVDGLKAQDAPVVYMSGNVLNVENPTGAAVEVYNMAGVKVFSDNSGEAVVRTQLDMRGAYIVKVGNTAVKVMR